MGVTIDTRLNFKQHVEYSCEKVSNTGMVLPIITSNVGGPRHTCRLVPVVSSLLYSVPVRGKALHILRNAHKLSATYKRTALMVCAFRTPPDDAVFVISRMMLIDILADKMANMHVYKFE